MRAGAWVLVRFIARRDRGLIALWIGVAVALPLFNAYSLAALLPTEETRVAFAGMSAGNPITRALLGPVHGTSIESLVAWRSGVQSLLITGLGGLLFAIRHTRAEEDSGRGELVAARPVGRQAVVTAVTVLVAVVNVAVTALLTVGLSLGFGYPPGGTLLFALTVGAGGMAFAACGLLAAQVCQSAALARGAGVGVLVAGLVPGVVVPESWIGIFPAGWPRLAQAYGAERWWVPLMPLAFAAGLTVAVFVLSSRRDLGAGVLPDRAGFTGPVRGRLGSPLALVWRLRGGQVVGWTVALGTAAAGVGWVSASFELATLTRHTLLAIFTYVFCMVVACLTVAGTLRPYTEESRGRAAPLLAAPTTRARWLGGHTALSLGAPVAMLLAVGLGSGAGNALGTGSVGPLLTQVGAALLFVPAAWAIAGVTIAVYGLRPRVAVPVAWAAVVVSAASVALWEAGTIGDTAFLLTPFGYVHPSISSGFVVPAAFVVVAAALVVAGGAGFARRDLLA
ncbi:hypothetical protein [Nonomuraea endophytica]|uniref:ABC-2 type transport system permease protein n=1 Tax=Nonomuraea endophytica TaxID=714136 RepID=A0A7W8EH05_9ACTN|nr:hypothetical protein [Nonomuraea endophytica]MBB5079104.1 ABC-2 type transport system permease protein [Nonomuraea endophytica]